MYIFISVQTYVLLDEFAIWGCCCAVCCSFDRVKEFFLEVTRRHLGQRILVVTHGGVLDDLFRLVR